MGDTCPKGLHKIETQFDIYTYQRKAKNGAVHNGRRCRRCKVIADAERKKTRRAPRVNLLDTGHCRLGHEIRDESDIYFWGERQRCRRCLMGARNRPQYVVFEKCGHQTYFVPPVPAKGEVIYDIRCREYKTVVDWIRADTVGDEEE